MNIIFIMMILTFFAYLFLLFLIKIVGSTQKETNSTDEAIQRDTDEFNQF